MAKEKALKQYIFPLDSASGRESNSIIFSWKNLPGRSPNADIQSVNHAAYKLSLQVEHLTKAQERLLTVLPPASPEDKQRLPFRRNEHKHSHRLVL